MEKDASFLNGEDHYTVSSLYFDTQDLSDYYDKAGGFLDRKKIRARFYEDFFTEKTSGIWLEIKAKHDMTVSKKRVWLDMGIWNRFVSSLYSPLSIKNEVAEEDLPMLRRLSYEINGTGRRPHIYITYHRKPYAYDWGANKFRLTFDYDIYSKNTSFIPNSNFHANRVTYPENAVMEVKYNGYLPPSISSILKKYNLKRDAYSKYSLGVDAARRAYPLSR